MKILVIIVSYKDERNLKECLASLDSCRSLPRTAMRGGNDKDIFDIYVHDNSSNNLGFAGGVNVALRFAQGKLRYDWIWLLNPDCTAEVKGILEDFIGFYGKKFDVWSPVVYDARGEIWFAGGKINRVTGECKHVREYRGNKGNKGDGSIETSWETEWVSGCSMFIKPRVFEKIGFFDEKFFLFYEDVDFCLRARAAGFKIGVAGIGGIGGIGGLGGLGSPRVIHKVSQSVNKLPNKYEIEMKSKFYLLKKHGDCFFPTAHLISKLRYLKHKLVKGI